MAGALVSAAVLILLLVLKSRTDDSSGSGSREKSASVAPDNDYLAALQQESPLPRATSFSDKPIPEMLDSGPADAIALTTATAQITRRDGTVLDLKTRDSEFARLIVEPNEVLTIRLALRNYDAGRPVRIDADNGGSLNRRLGPLVINPADGSDAIEFQYAAGGHRGKYTVVVTQGDREELLEFRVGPEPLTGQAGSLRIFSPNNT